MKKIVTPMQNVSSDAPVSHARKSKSSNKLKVECLKGWLKDHAAFKPSIGAHVLSQKFTVKKQGRNR